MPRFPFGRRRARKIEFEGERHYAELEQARIHSKPAKLEIKAENGVEPQPPRHYKTPTAYDLDTFLTKADFKVDWERRRVRIDISLIFLGFLLAVILIGMLGSVYVNKSIDPNLSYIFSGAIWAILISFVTILGTYCFGPSFDQKNIRKNAAIMFTSLNTNGPLRNVSATTTTETTITPENP